MSQYEKIYTRDTTLIIQEGWVHGNLEGLKDALGFQNPFDPFAIYHMTHGSLEIWEHVGSTPWLKEQVYAYARLHPEKILARLESYEKELQKLEPVWQKGILDSKSELIAFTNTIFATMTGYLLMYYLAMDENERIPTELKNKAFLLRDKDAYFDNSDHVLRNTLSKLYPEIRQYVTCILRKELETDRVPNLNQCKERFESFFMTPHTIETIPFDTFKTNHPDVQFLETHGGENAEITGQIAFKGKVIGPVRVVWRKAQGDEVREGEIIVAPMTTPAIIQAMRRASAFVTDEGGITCHAAIVAREMKKPCIIGTKIATKVLKDGDEVEVNAETGIVRIIKKAGS